MAQRVVKLPDIGEGTTEAEIVGWLVSPVGMAVHEISTHTHQIAQAFWLITVDQHEPRGNRTHAAALRSSIARCLTPRSSHSSG